MEQVTGRKIGEESDRYGQSGGMERKGLLENCDGIPHPIRPEMVNCKQRFLICRLHISYQQNKWLIPVVLEEGLATAMVCQPVE